LNEGDMSGQTTIKMLSIDNKTLTTDLDRAGYRKMGVLVRAAASFDEAEKLLKADKIDLVVINMDFKSINAVQICKHLKSSAAYATMPVVLTSVQTAAKVRNSALGAGADLFVEQPLPRQYFIEKLKQLLEHSTRTTHRVAVESQVTFTIAGKTASCKVGDLSVSGILLATELELDSGVAVQLEFELPAIKKAIRVDGEVVRTIKQSQKHPDRPTGIGIRFTTFHDESQKRLEQYLEKSADQDDRMLYYH
jgi:DNA-binding response OmpR family regulator